MSSSSSSSSSSSHPVIIIGGGISGLSTAWFLHQRGHQVLVLESRNEIGGTIKTTHKEGFLVEHGPNSTMQKPGDDDALGELVQGVGLDQELLEANKIAKKRYVMRGGKLQALPGSPPAMLTSPLFSWKAKLRLLREPFIARSNEQDETLAHFVARRLGQEFLDYAVEPFVSGVYAGDPKRLSAKAAVPKIYTLEQDHGSLIRGALAKQRSLKGASGPTGRMISFKQGMDSLPKAVEKALPEGSVKTGCLVQSVEKNNTKWQVNWQDKEGTQALTTDRVIFSTPAPATAELMAPISEPVAELLREIPYAPICSVVVGYNRNQVTHLLDGFGFLIPRLEGVTLLGGLFSTTLFPGRAADGRVLITAFIGGMMKQDIVDWSDEQVMAQVEGDLGRALDIDGEPLFRSLTRYRQSIPQYEVGHLARIEKLDGLMEELPGLMFRANWRDGISVTDCVKQGKITAEKLYSLSS